MAPTRPVVRTSPPFRCFWPVQIEDALVARETPEFIPGRGGDWKYWSVIFGGLIWAFTRNDAISDDRIAYEAFALDAVDNR